ncbi:MAG TPA: DNA mismatch repair protein MutS, partial [Pirellulaceae bacterium]|nr:DNA mismatch repair protein MutS [Pirellulaceae bacterium]
MAATPMMQQYQDAKAACGEALLLFRMGDFYELFYDDAKTAARVLGLTLTSRDKGENPVPMAGFPYHQLESYLGKLIAAGLRAAVCEQVEDPKLAKGLVKRELTRVVSPGTLTDDALLDPRQSNYLAAVALPAHQDNGDSRAGIAWAELSTGRFLAASMPLARLADELARIGPAECLLAEEAELPAAVAGRTMLTRRPAWAFNLQTATATLQQQFQTATLGGFGFDERDGPALAAAGAVLDYLRETQKTSLAHFDRLLPYRAGQALEIDEATRRSLELTRTIRSGSREGSLLAVIDQTVTPLGARLLADWLANPLTQASAIDARLDAVAHLAADEGLRAGLREKLRGVYDLERLLARVATGRASPRDLSFVARTLAGLPKLKELLASGGRQPPGGAAAATGVATLSGCSRTPLAGATAGLLTQLEAAIDPCPELAAQLASALVDDCPLAAREGGIFRGGYHGPLDSLRDLAAGGKQWIARYQAEEARKTGIANLKVAYNKVFGYYIEIT